MADENPGLGLELPAQPFGEIDRAVLSAGAADGHRQVIAVVPDIGRQPGGDERGNVVPHAADLGLGLEEIDDRLVAAGERAQG